MNQHQNKTETILLMTGAGLLGASLALIFAPQSGKRTRKQIKRVAGDISDRVADFGEEMSDRVDGLLEEYRELRGKSLEKGEDLKDSLLDSLRKSREKISSRIARLEEEVRN